MVERAHGVGAVHVFVGPSCPAVVLHEQFPQILLHSPIRHGDLFSSDIGAGDTVVIIDGLYHQTLALRHKEILDAMERGVTVIGAGSIGAFRAVELGPFGMIGSGVVFGWYRDGVFEGDDAVAVAHSEGDGYVAVSTPLVNFYAALLAAADAGIVERQDLPAVLDEVAGVFYPDRTVDRILGVLKHAGHEELADWYDEQMAENPARFDQKRTDCLQAVGLAVSGAARSPEGTRLVVDRDWHTIHFHSWRAYFTGAEEKPPLRHRIAFQKLFNPDFPEVWWEYLRLSLTGTRAGAACQAWTTLSENPLEALELDAADLEHASAEIRTLVATLICPVADVADQEVVTLLLSRERPEHLTTLAAYLAEADRMTAGMAPRARRARLSGFNKVLGTVWGVEKKRLYSESRRRGFANVGQAGQSLRRLTIGAPESDSVT